MDTQLLRYATIELQYRFPGTWHTSQNKKRHKIYKGKNGKGDRRKKRKGI